jgi:hypothetical protein
MIEKKNIRILIEGVVNKMIPNNKNFIVTKTNKILNMDKFLRIINKNKIIKKKIQNINNLIKKSENKNYHYFINEIFKSKIIESHIQEQLLEDYFTSKKIIKILETKSKIFLNQYKERDINHLLRYVKKFKFTYKKI